MRVLVSFLIFLLTGPVLAQNPTGPSARELQDRCRPVLVSLQTGAVPKDEMFESGYCIGMFDAVFWQVGFDQVSAKNFKICLPNGATRNDLIKIFMVFAEKRPEFMDDFYLPAVLASLQFMYPCK